MIDRGGGVRRWGREGIGLNIYTTKEVDLFEGESISYLA